MAFDYIRRVWTARQGTNLNKFTKSGETSASVVLTNTPDLVSVDGTPFTAGAMNNIENGVEATRAVSHLSELFKDSVDMPYDIVTDGTYLYYIAGSGAKLYKMSIATKAITELTTVANARALCLYNGVLYIVYYDNTSRGYTTYNVSTNEFAFYTVTGVNLDYATGIVCDGTYLYAAQSGLGRNSIFKINMSTHVGETWVTSPNAADLCSLAYDGTYLYAADIAERITRLKLSDKSATTWQIKPITTDYTLRCTVVDGVYGYVLTTGTGTTGVIFKISLSDGSIVDTWSVGGSNIYGLCKNDTDFYVTEQDGDKINRVYQSTSLIAPSSILPQSISTADVTVTENRFGNIVLSGVLTGNRILVIPSEVRAYQIINNCTGVYYVTIKTASGTGINSYANDVLTIICDGTDIRLTGWNENLPEGVERLSPDYWRGYPVYYKRFAGKALVDSPQALAHGISGTFSARKITGIIKKGTTEYTCPHAALAALANNVGLKRTSTDVIIQTGDADLWSGFTAYITIEYIKA